MSEGGRFGINWASPEMNSHSIYLNTNNDGIDGLIVGGIYNKRIIRYYEIVITDNVPTPNTYKWRVSTDYGQTWSDYSADFTCTQNWTDLENGITINFSNVAGFSLNDKWRFWAFPQLPGASLSVSSDMYYNVTVCYDTTGPVSGWDLHDKTYNSASIFPAGYLMLSGNSSLMYIGNTRPFNSIYVGINIPSSGVSLKIEYLGWSGWTEMTYNNCNYIDQTYDLTQSGLISWDTSEMNDWDWGVATGMTESLYWLRLTSITPILIEPLCFLVAPHDF